MKQDWLTTPVSIIIASIIISFSILLSNGVITFKGVGTKKAAVQDTNAVVEAPNTQPTIAPEIKTLSKEDKVRGSRDARILLIEYSDLECPFCKKFHPTAKQAVQEYNGQLAWVYRHFPLDQLHSKARKESEAVECAYQQTGEDGFWKLTDKIYEVTPANNGLNLEDLPKLAAEVGLDQYKLKTCLDSGKTASIVEADYQSGIKAGVNGTPGNILYDTKSGKSITVPGAVPLETLKQSIDSLLKS